MEQVNLEWTTIVAERKIQEAMEAGEFDNLKGAGEPLLFDDEDSTTPLGMRIANKILKNSRALPEWLQLEQDTESEIAQIGPRRESHFRALRAAKNRASQVRIANRLRDEMEERMRLVNDLILKYHMIAPGGGRRAFGRFRVKEELTALEDAIAVACGRIVSGAEAERAR